MKDEFKVIERKKSAGSFQYYILWIRYGPFRAAMMGCIALSKEEAVQQMKSREATLKWISNFDVDDTDWLKDEIFDVNEADWIKDDI